MSKKWSTVAIAILICLTAALAYWRHLNPSKATTDNAELEPIAVSSQQQAIIDGIENDRSSNWQPASFTDSPEFEEEL